MVSEHVRDLRSEKSEGELEDGTERSTILVGIAWYTREFDDAATVTAHSEQ